MRVLGDGGGQLACPGELAKTGLILPDRLEYEEWARIGVMLQNVERSVRWWIGDWLAFGERKYGETYVQAVEATGRKVEDLMNMAYVSRRIEFSSRDENLSWSHHRAVAPLEPAEQRTWLAIASEEGWSSKDLHRHVNAMTVAPPSVNCRECGAPCPSCKQRMAIDPSSDSEVSSIRDIGR